MDSGQFWGFRIQFCPKKWDSPTFQPDHQVYFKNTPFKDSKTAAVSGFAIIVKLRSFLDWSILNECSLINMLKTRYYPTMVYRNFFEYL